MKKLLPFLVVLVIAATAYATDYTISTSTARQDQILNQDRVIRNTQTCASVNLAANCTQAQARAVNPALNVYTTTQDYLQRYHGPIIFANAKASIAAYEAQQLCRWWNNTESTTRAMQDEVCVKIGLAAGCELCN